MNLKSKIRIRKSYTTKYDEPIVVNKGDVVILGEKQKWIGWIWATLGNFSG